MLARRIIAVSPDKAFLKQLGVALKAAGGAVDTHLSLEEVSHGEIHAALLVLHLDGAMATEALELIPRLTGETRVIAVLPRSNLAAVVDVMQGSDRVAGMMAAEDFDMKLLSAMATRVLAGDIFGLEKHVPWGAQIHSYLVGDYQEKSLCISQISEFAEAMSVRRKYRESIEQCLDEMLMNALYDAPVDEQGRPIFSEIPTKTRISLRVEQKVVVQYACDGKQFVIGVRDSFGTLDRATVLRYLHKCLHNEQQIDRKAGGAGLGLYLITNSSTGVYFNVLPGVATEAVCTFDLETPKIQLESFGFFVEKIDAAGRLAAGPSKRLPAGASHPVERRQPPLPAAGSRALIAVLILAILAVLGLAAVVAYPRLTAVPKADLEVHTVPSGAVVELEGRNAGTAVNGVVLLHDLEIGRTYPLVARLDGYEPRQAVVQPHGGNNAITLELTAHAATVELDSTPGGASVEIDGKPAGSTPLTVKTLVPNATISLVFKKPGYRDAPTQITVPSPGKETKLIQPLAVSDELARVMITSDPPGAQITQNGQLRPGVVTPYELLVEAGKTHSFVLSMPRKVPAVLPPFIPVPGSANAQLTAKLADGITLRLRANLDVKFNVSGSPHCQDVDVPFDCVVSPGPHQIDVVHPLAVRVTRQVVAKQKDLDVKFELGYVEAGPGRQLVIGNTGSVRRAMLETGARRITVIGGDESPRSVGVTVRPKQTTQVN